MRRVFVISGSRVAESAGMLADLRAMPVGLRVFLIYGFTLLALIGVTLPAVVATAATMPISPLGLLWMLLLAYLIFTLTLVFGRKRAGYGFSIGLATLTLPLVPLLALIAGIPGVLVGLGIAVILALSLTRPAVRAWFVEP